MLIKLPYTQYIEQLTYMEATMTQTTIGDRVRSITFGATEIRIQKICEAIDLVISISRALTDKRTGDISLDILVELREALTKKN